jgi:predicted XRE-type DNA-binding protein
MLKGKISYEGKEFHFTNLANLTIQAGGKPWVYDSHTDTALRFKLASMGGRGGLGNYLKQWRKRRQYSQAEAAEVLRVSQSLIARIENGERSLSGEIFQKIRQDNRSAYGR